MRLFFITLLSAVVAVSAVTIGMQWYITKKGNPFQ